jgi:hypothetical protein
MERKSTDCICPFFSFSCLSLPEVNLRYDKVSIDQTQELIDIINKYVSKFGYSVNVL